MKVKKYIAPTMTEALAQIKQELGSDAVILNSKQIKVGGVLGLFKKSKTEVIVALDENPLTNRREAPPKIASPIKDKQLHRDSVNELNQQEVLQEIKQLRHIVMTQSRHKPNHFAVPFDTIFTFLLDQEVDPQLAEEMVASMEKQAEQQKMEQSDIPSFLRQFIYDALLPEFNDTTMTHKKVIQFVGPTGVGKTTTIAKVAAKIMLQQKKTVAFITTDTYRIAAIEQLKTYARILDVPIEVAYSKADYQHALEKFSTYDHIFVDTAGRNYRETAYVTDLEDMIEFDHANQETYLVLSLSAKAKDNLDIFHVFNKKGVDQVILTKLDETTTYGSFINLCYGEHAKVAYISNGQNVPDDIVPADATFITELLISRYIYE